MEKSRSQMAWAWTAGVVVAAAAVAGAQAPSTGFADRILGRWDLTVQGTAGPYPSWLEIQLRKETEIMGRFVGRSGSVRHLAHVEYANDDLRFSLPVQYERNTADIVFAGRLVGDRLEGTTVAEDGRTLSWTGVRAPSLVRPAPRAWGAPVRLIGTDLGGWTLRAASARQGCWAVKDGVLSVTPPCTDLVSTQRFTDFKLRTEFSYPAKSNSGIYLRGRYEVQIQDDAGKVPDPLRMGGVYGFLRPDVDAAGAPGAWQTYEITLVGRRVTVVLNAKTVIDNEVIPGTTGGALDSDEGSPGPILLQGDHGPVSFRNLVVIPAR